MKTKRMIALAFLLLFAVFGVSAGGQSEGEPTGVNLQYWFWDPDFEKDELDMIAKFERANPGTKVQLTSIESGQYWVKMMVLAASKQIPDVIAMDPNSVEDIIGQNAVLDLTPLIARDFARGDVYWEAMEANFEFGGKIWAVPFALVGGVYYYNMDLLDKLGLPYPKESWTWNEALDYFKKLTIDENGDGEPEVWGTSPFGRYVVYDGWVVQNNGDFLDRKKMRWAPDQAAVQAMKFVNDLAHVHKVAPNPKRFDLTAGVGRQRFADGKVAMISEGSWGVQSLRYDQPAGFRWDIVQFPRGPKWQKDVFDWCTDGFSISATTKHPEDAWKFIYYVLTERKADEYYGGKIPFVRAVANAPAFDEWATKKLLPVNKTRLLKYAEHGKSHYTKFWTAWRGYGSAQNAGLAALIDASLAGEISFEEYLRRAEEMVNLILAKAYK